MTQTTAPTVQTLQEIVAEWRSTGREFRIDEAVTEQKRQAREWLRERESALLVAAEEPGGEHLRGVADQIREHRDADKYTTQG